MDGEFKSRSSFREFTCIAGNFTTNPMILRLPDPLITTLDHSQRIVERSSCLSEPTLKSQNIC